MPFCTVYFVLQMQCLQWYEYLNTIVVIAANNLIILNSWKCFFFSFFTVALRELSWVAVLPSYTQLSPKGGCLKFRSLFFVFHYHNESIKRIPHSKHDSIFWHCIFYIVAHIPKEKNLENSAQWQLPCQRHSVIVYQHHFPYFEAASGGRNSPIRSWFIRLNGWF